MKRAATSASYPVTLAAEVTPKRSEKGSVPQGRSRSDNTWVQGGATTGGDAAPASSTPPRKCGEGSGGVFRTCAEGVH